DERKRGPGLARRHAGAKPEQERKGRRPGDRRAREGDEPGIEKFYREPRRRQRAAKQEDAEKGEQEPEILAAGEHAARLRCVLINRDGSARSPADVRRAPEGVAKLGEGPPARENRIVAQGFLNPSCRLVAGFESMLLTQGPKIVLQHIHPESWPKRTYSSAAVQPHAYTLPSTWL